MQDDKETEEKKEEEEEEEKEKEMEENENEQEQEEEEEEEEKTVRRDWFRRADEQFSSSLSGNDDSPESPSDAVVSINAELLGAYPRTRSASNSSRTVDASCDSQRRCLPVASTNTEQSSGHDEGQGGDAEETIEDAKERSSRAVIESGTAGGPGGEELEKRQLAEVVADSDVAIEDRIVKPDDGSAGSGCSCEGACGCATVVRRSSSFKERPIGRLWSSVRCISMDRNLAGRSTIEETTNKRQTSWQREAGKEEWERERNDEYEEREEMEEEESREEEEEDEEFSFRSKSSTIVKLLGGGRRTGKRLTKKSGGSTGASIAGSPIPCGTFAKSARKLPICQREGYFGRTSTIGGLISSYEKLSNGELKGSRRSMHASDPVSIGSSRSVEQRRYSSCDLESLYEGIRILDELLVRRGLAVAHGRKQSVTVMLFGTPRHGATTRRRSASEEGTIREIGRVSRFSLDALSN